MFYDEKIAWWKKLYFKVEYVCDKIVNIPVEIKYFIQRGRRGYSNKDLWSFDWYLAKMIPSALRELAKKAYGCPSEFYKQEKEGTNVDPCQDWIDTLNKIADGFDAIYRVLNQQNQDQELNDLLCKMKPRFVPIKGKEDLSNDQSTYTIETSWTKEEEERYHKRLKELNNLDLAKFNESMDLMKKYFMNLWD